MKKAIKEWINFCKRDMETHPDFYKDLPDAMDFHVGALIIVIEKEFAKRRKGE